MSDFVLNPKLFEIKSPPGDTLLETIEAIGMSQVELALRMGRPLKTINEIIKGKAAITPETALQLEKVLGISASFWINRERQYRESLAREGERNSLDQKTRWLQQIPVNEMIELGWMDPFDEPVKLIEAALKFFGIASPDQWLPVSLGKYAVVEKHPSLKRNLGSVTAWLRKGELEAQQQPCEPFQTKYVKESLALFRELTLLPVQSFYPRLKELCNQVGVAFCIVPELSGVRIYGITRWITNDKALIQMSDRYQQDDAFWFAFYHAMGHLLFHGKRDIFIEAGGVKDQKEIEAEKFAKDQLISASILQSLRSDTKAIQKERIEAFSNELNLSPGILVRGLQSEGMIGPDQFNDLKRQFVWGKINEGERLEDEAIEDDYIDEEEPSFRPPAEKQPVVLPANLWPGLSAGAAQALVSAGYGVEAGRADEQLFADWVRRQLENVESARAQGYYRDALMDLENLISIVRLGRDRSPALRALEDALSLLKNAIQPSSARVPVEQEMFDLVRQAIIEVNQQTHDQMLSEARKQYSAAATKSESGYEDLFLRSR